MHPDLTRAFGRLVELIEQDPRCKGGWHYGSVGRGQADDYSDYDPVFLVSGADFEAFAADAERYVGRICDELLIHWPENYNGKAFKNFCSLVRLGDRPHQLDFFVLNADRTDDWWCRQHLKGCTRANLIFDRSGETGALLDRGLRTDDGRPDARRAVETYWFHVAMLVKYFKRGDLFKIVKNVDMVFHAHVDLLLAGYDTLDWGAWETKVKQCVPPDRQEHLLAYFTHADRRAYAGAVRRAMVAFNDDALEICRAKGIDYPSHVAKQVMDWFRAETEGL
jgi:predicted nucleotidyltransferase